MKLTTLTTALLALLTIPISVLGESEEKETETKIETNITTKSIKLQEGESIEDVIQKVIEGVDVDSEGNSKALINTTTITIDEEGNSEVTSLDNIENPEDIGEAVKIAISTALKKGQKANKTTLIGPDGKQIQLKDGESLADAINEMIKKVSPEDGTFITGIGPAFVTGSGGTAGIKKELEELRSELAEQRKLLEAIHEKLQ